MTDQELITIIKSIHGELKDVNLNNKANMKFAIERVLQTTRDAIIDNVFDQPSGSNEEKIFDDENPNYIKGSFEEM